jgi:Glycosyltransferases involved in cell wall biogenesis
MKLSVIICTYNSSKTLPEALDSVLAQSYDEYEILIMDGLSSDGTIEIIKSYEKKFNGKLRFVSEKDEGVYDAMNKGIDLAKGDWIYFLGSDDVFYSKDVLERVSQEAEESGLEVVYGNVKWGETERIYDGEFSRLKLLNDNICHQSIFYKRNLFQKFGKFDLEYKVWADYLFNIKWFNDNGTKRKYTNIVIAKYNTEGLSSKAGDKKFIKNKEKIIRKYFPKEYVEFNDEIKKKIRKSNKKNKN